MRRFILPGLALAMLILAASVYRAGAADQPKKEMITGEINCLYCYASRTDMGADPVGCQTRCITKKAMPAVVVQEGTGEAFVIVWKGGESAVPKLAPLIGKKVNVQGPVYKKGGVNVIEAQIIAEAM